MARAKCKICGTQLDTNTAYKITDKNGKNKYFCSATEFKAEEVRKKRAAEDKDRVYRLICDIMCEKEIISTALYKEWAIWNKVADNDKIAKYLEENKEYLTSVMLGIGSSEYGCIRYLSAIIRDKIKGFVPRAEVAEKPKVVIDETIYDAPTRSLNKRRSLEDVEDMF